MLPPIFQNENQPPNRNFPSGVDNQMVRPARLMTPNTGTPPMQQPNQPPSNFTSGIATQAPPQGVIGGTPQGGNITNNPNISGGTLAPQHNPNGSEGRNSNLGRVLSIIELLIKTGQLR